MSDWQPIETAPKDGAAIHARDADGDEHVTRFFDGSWVYMGWRETEDRDEYETEEWWEPTEWLPNGTVVVLAGSIMEFSLGNA